MDITTKLGTFINEKSEYMEFFQKKLKKFGAKGVGSMDDETKKKFFNEIEKEWKGKDEK